MCATVGCFAPAVSATCLTEKPRKNYFRHKIQAEMPSSGAHTGDFSANQAARGQSSMQSCPSVDTLPPSVHFLNCHQQLRFCSTIFVLTKDIGCLRQAPKRVVEKALSPPATSAPTGRASARTPTLVTPPSTSTTKSASAAHTRPAHNAAVPVHP
jgi:hypothetical protein